jgi:hypothetical protein
MDWIDLAQDRDQWRGSCEHDTYYIKLHFGQMDQNSVVHNHNTRQKLNPHVQFCRTNVVKNGVMNMGIRLYNRIPNKIREVEKMRQVKRVLRSYLVQHMFYSVEEYILS